MTSGDQHLYVQMHKKKNLVSVTIKEYNIRVLQCKKATSLSTFTRGIGDDTYDTHAVINSYRIDHLREVNL
jgi:hypothetical protein